jgi:anti-sigma factor RsiW
VPTLSVVHLFGLILLLGSIFMIALRCFGLAWRRDGAAAVVRAFAPATVVGLVLMIGSGSLLFAAGADRYVASVSFEYKMVALAVAVSVQSGVYVVAARETAPPDRVVTPKWTVIGGLMFLLWLTVAVFGRFIAYY